MKKSAKALIESAIPRQNVFFNHIWIIDSEKKYNGFWGKNGYNNIIILGRSDSTKSSAIELIADGVNEECDVFRIEHENGYGAIDFDIRHERGVLHLYTSGWFKLQIPVVSSCTFTLQRGR